MNANHSKTHCLPFGGNFHQQLKLSSLNKRYIFARVSICISHELNLYHTRSFEKRF